MKLLLYCTKAKPYITRGTNGSIYPSCVISDGIQEWHLNGKIVAECDFEVETYLTEKSWFSKKIEVINKRICDGIAKYNGTDDMLNFILNKSCLTIEELTNYMNFENNVISQKYLYAIHIKNLHIFDEPREITDLVLLNQYRKDLEGQQYNRVKVAPQNMCLVDYAAEVFGKYDCTNYLLDSPYVLISIRPEWLCKILNGQKTIEVRKKILKGMIK